MPKLFYNFKKIIIIFFLKYDGKNLNKIHQMVVFTLTPTEGFSNKTALEMCKAGFSKFPEKMDSVYVDTSLTGAD